MTSGNPAETPVEAIFFDLGGTLFSYRVLLAGTPVLLKSFAARLGADATESELAAVYLEGSSLAFARHGSRAYYLHRDIFHEGFAHFARRVAGEGALGEEDVADFIEWAYVQMRDWMIDNCVLRDECLEVLGALRDRGYSLSVVSNIDEDFLHPMIDRFGLAPFLHHWSSSEEARSCKPDRAFFEMALRKAGVEAERVLFVGDSPEHDIAGANALGMRTVLIAEDDVAPPGQQGGVDEALLRATWDIRDLRELLPILRALPGR